MKTIWGLFAVLVLAGCGGGSSETSTPTPTPPPPDLSPGGIWEGTQTSGGTSIGLLGLITETGEFHFIREDGVQAIGALGVSANTASGTFEAAAPFGFRFEDGSVNGGGNISFTIAERQTLTGTFTFTTAGGTTTNGTISFAYNPLYERDASLTTIAGTYTNSDAPGSDALTIGSNGGLFYQDGSGTNCTANGAVSVINSAFNAYRVSFQYAGCSGDFAILNGAAFAGIGTLDNTASPETIVAGVTGTVQGARLALIYSYQRF